MPQDVAGLLAQIEDGALDSSVPLSDTLRKCVALGGRAGSDELRDWARLELDGYLGDEDLPDYRTVPAFFALDGVTMTAQITQQQIPYSQLPEKVREHLKEQVELRYGVAELQDMADGSSSGAVRLMLPGMGEIARYLTYQAQQEGHLGQHISSVYWVLSSTSILGVLDKVRTVLVALVAELRAVGVGDNDVPTAEAAAAAVSVVLHGGKRNTVNITTAHAMGTGPATATGNAAGKDVRSTDGNPDSEKVRIPGWIRGPWGLLVGSSAVVAAYAGLAAGTGWWPF